MLKKLNKLRIMKLVKALAKNLCPPFLWTGVKMGLKFLIKLHTDIRMPQVDLAKIFAANAALCSEARIKNRCFVLLCGPSVNKQDLTLLRDEFCIAVNEFYLHKNFDVVNPAFYFSSGVVHHGFDVSPQGITYLKRLDQQCKSQTMLFNITDHSFIQELGLFQGKKSHYFAFNSSYKNLENNGIDLTKPLCSYQGSSIAALQLMLGMGFKEIYILGADHNWFQDINQEDHTTQDKHFYNADRSAFYAVSKSTYKYSYFDLYRDSYFLWSQYISLKEYAQKSGIKIFNATEGGYLDVFERVRYESLFESPIKG